MSPAECLCVIPARSGSKRIPNKNTRLFCGKPIMAYSIEAALESGCFAEVMVSTDDPHIADVAREHGASVPFMRSRRTAGDFAGLAEVMVEVLEVYARRGRTFPLIACVLATAPFVASTDLRSASDRLGVEACDGILTVCRYVYPIQRALVERRGRLRMRWPRYYNSRSQDLEPCYHDAGQFYFLRTAAFLRHRRLLLRDMLKYELPESRVQDIDTEEDWRAAELKYRALHG
ncbi:MAG: pseudaminic acid cytidylyltransferase [Spirochaetales bacterium]|nr:pseudaminic acid cytidylyltransferase [Spirochaetales bacterium]